MDQPPEPRVCINCNAESVGVYCTSCGQRMEVKRITFKEGWQDFWARIYGFDGMFPRTLRDLTFRPGFASRRFIEGNRVAYYGPVGYFFLMITLFLLVLSMLDLDYVDFIKGAQEEWQISQTNANVNTAVQRFAADNIKLMAFMIIPFMAFSSRYVFFRRSGYNFLENSILPFYVIGHIYWYSIASAVYYKATGNVPSHLIDTVLTILFAGFSYTSFITYQSKVKVFLKGVLLYLFSMLALMLLFTILAIISILVLAWLDPETLKAIKPSGG